jgi:glycosyltransferase involved in cell wall biosynthesis
MRILIISNFYPPSRSWGYTQLCQETVENLEKRGHTVAVMTSDYLAKRVTQAEPNIYRQLHIESDPNHYQPLSFFTTRRRYIKQDQDAIRKIIHSYQPDVVFIWGMWNMPKDLPAYVESLEGIKVVFYLSDHWPVYPSTHDVYWNLPGRRLITRPVKALLNKFSWFLLSLERENSKLKFEHPICVSQSLKESLVEKGIPIQHAEVIYNGIDTNVFRGNGFPENGGTQNGDYLKLIVAGRLSPDKGIHTAIEGMANLVYERNIKDVQLTIVGEGESGYEDQLKSLISRLDLDRYISMRGRAERQHMPELLRQHDILVFPSISAEALPRMPQEAMACGLAVIGTNTGGTKELIINEISGLTFQPDDPLNLASQIARLHANPDYRLKLAEAGRSLVYEKFDLDRMIAEIEGYLALVVTSSVE